MRQDRSNGMLAAVMGVIALVLIAISYHDSHVQLTTSPALTSPTPILYCERFCDSPLPCPTIIPTAEPVLGPGGVVIGYQCPVPQQ
jgi:hypothetical protein